ncbi:response regulator [Isachenkonia alkalipeptolytica]|uniref:Stage 0 sporulation protein A homolog n=1 Tax=Isachenkonia alkalipeptolytica TaxID=2565777 RepID=A0AA43XJM7_9CLOT|nr:response regulator [Isachenkonia alkalipeptolytica]
MNYESKIFVVDDDSGVRRMVSNIIEEEGIGQVIGEAEDGMQAIDQVMDLQPDLVMIDLLMPELDGIETIKKLRKSGYGGTFVLLSKITDKMMVREAYRAGVEFYIQKPINKEEVSHVVKKVLRYKGMEKTFQNLQFFLNNQDLSHSPQEGKPKTPGNYLTKQDKANNIAENIAMDLGILSQSGSGDILEAMSILAAMDYPEDMKLLQNLKLLYEKIGERYEKSDNRDVARGEKAIERRIRRTIEYALNNLANLGIEDYHHPKFERFGHRLFDFAALREEMLRIQKKSDKKPKINVKRFLEGMLREVKQEDFY